MVKELGSEERIRLALQHKEPDRVPFDLGGTTATGINMNAYRGLLDYLGITKDNTALAAFNLQLAKPDEEALERLKVDTRMLSPCSLHGASKPEITEDEDYKHFTDAWRIGWKMPKAGGHYYDMYRHPLQGEINKERIDNYSFPNVTDLIQTVGLKEKAKEIKRNKKAIVVDSLGGGILDMGFLLRGYQDFYLDLAANPSIACYLMDRIVEMRLVYWDIVLKEVGDYIFVVYEDDDLGQQNGTIISPEMYRKYIKPRQKKVFAHIKKIAPKPVYILLHTCGSVYDIIPDLIEIGIDIINPVQFSAAKMDPARLKREFGKELSFWGGGIDTQNTLPRGTPQQVRDEVRRRIEDFAPGGGFIFSTVHNIQDDVPSENIMAMWETLQKYGAY